MELSKYIIGFFFVILTFAAFGVGYVSLTNTYNVTISDTFKGAYTNNTELVSILDDTTGLGANMTESAKSAKQLEGDYSDPSKAMIKSLKIVWDSFDIAKGLILGVSELLHLPPIIASIIIGIIIILIVFAFISVIFRFKT